MSPTMTALQQQFEDLARAANMANDAGLKDLAGRLDRMARTANARCSNYELRYLRNFTTNSKGLTWRDVPTTLTRPNF
jgi:hypothetical protein